MRSSTHSTTRIPRAHAGHSRTKPEPVTVTQFGAARLGSGQVDRELRSIATSAVALRADSDPQALARNARNHPFQYFIQSTQQPLEFHMRATTFGTTCIVKRREYLLTQYTDLRYQVRT